MAAMAAMTSSAAVVAALPAGLRSTGSSAGRQVVSFGVRRAAVERVARKAMEVRAGMAPLSELEGSVKQAIHTVKDDVMKSALMKQASFLAFNALMVLPALAEEVEKEPKGKIFDFNLTLPIIAVQFSQPASRRAPASLPAAVVVAAEASPKAAAVSRRQLAVSLTSLSVALLSSSQRQAEARESRDIPLFGLKKAKQIGSEVVQEVKELVKEGEGEVAAVGGAISAAVAGFPGAALPNIPSGGDSGLSPALQAGVVAGAGVVGVLVASTVVNSLVSPVK